MRHSVFGGIAGFLLFGLAALSAPCEAVSAATLVLKDGTIIQGKIETLQGDVYTVSTETLGTVRVRKEDVRTIDHSGESRAESFPESAELQAMQLRMMQNPNLLSMIQALQSDPDVQAVLADPEIISAIASGNYAVLMNHPKMIALTRNPKMREIVDKAQ